MKTGMLLLFILLSGCATSGPVNPSMIDGSKSDGIVKFAHQYYSLLGAKPQVNYTLMDIEAENACENWGYDFAKMMRGALEECTSYNGYGNCKTKRVTHSYQCVNGDNAGSDGS